MNARSVALSANSPFWQGLDSAYSSFRYQVWGRWPSSGPTEPFGTAQAYRETVQQMVGTGTLLDTGMVYFNARLSERYPTIEIRIADVCLRADDAVLIAALARALVETEARSWREGRNVPQTRTELLRLAAWRASRSGLDTALLNPVTGQPEQAEIIVHMLLDHCRDALAETGESDTVAELLTALLARGDGAAFQRPPTAGPAACRTLSVTRSWSPNQADRPCRLADWYQMRALAGPQRTLPKIPLRVGCYTPNLRKEPCRQSGCNGPGTPPSRS